MNDGGPENAWRIIAVTLAVTVLLAVLVAGYPAAWLMHNRAMDLPSYYVAGVMARQGLNIYDPGLFVGTARALGLGDPIYPYIYFPMLALVFIPLSKLDYPAVQLIWFGVSQVFLWLSVFLLHSLIRPRIPARRRITWRLPAVMLLCGLSAPLVEDLRNGQVNVLILFLLTAFLVLMRDEKEIAAGVVLGLVGMLKPQPLLIVPCLFLVRRFRAGTAAFIAFVGAALSSGAVIGFDSLKYYIREILPTFNMVKTSYPPIMNFAPPNQSIQGVVSRFFQNTPFSRAIIPNPALTIPVCRGLTAVILLFMALSIVRDYRRFSGSSFAALFRYTAWILMTTLIISPITWNHHLVILAIPGCYALWAMKSFRKPADFLLTAAWIVLILPLNPFSDWWIHQRFLHLGMSMKAFALVAAWLLFRVRFFGEGQFPQPNLTESISPNKDVMPGSVMAP